MPGAQVSVLYLNIRKFHLQFIDNRTCGAKIKPDDQFNPDYFMIKKIGDYEIIDKLGQGGMGVVYRARHTSTRRLVALKTLYEFEPGFLEYIRHEVEILAQLDQPGIIRILDSDMRSSQPWYAMEFISGRTLREFFNRGAGNGSWWSERLDERSVGAPERVSDQPEPASRTSSAEKKTLSAGQVRSIIEMARKICRPLAFLHSRGIIHLDLKPENILVRADDLPVIVDFGLASMMWNVWNRDVVESYCRGIGTIAYMAPELVNGEGFDSRADLFSLGCILYELLTGRLPFYKKEKISGKTLKQTVTPLSEVVNGVPEELDTLVMKLLNKRPEVRVGYAVEVEEMLAAIVGDSAHFSESEYRLYLHRPGFKGRKSAWKRVDRILIQAMLGKGEFTLIGGESGIGKTRFAVEVANYARKHGFQVLIGDHSPLAETGEEAQKLALYTFRKPLRRMRELCLKGGYGKFRDVLTEHADILSDFEPALVDLVPRDHRCATQVLPQAEARIRICHSLYSVFSELSRIRPLLLILDDLQWADSLSLEFIESFFSGAPIRCLPIVVLATFRTEEPIPEIRRMEKNNPRILLEGVTADESYEIISGMLNNSDLPPVIVQALIKHSEGNPFYIAEYLRSCVDENILIRSRFKWRFSAEYIRDNLDSSQAVLPEFPAGLQRMIEHRLRFTDETQKEILRIASVFGREFPLKILAAVYGTDHSKLMEAIRELTRRQIIKETAPGIFRFAHDRTLKAVYSAVQAPLRKQLHRRCAEVITARFPEFERKHYPEMAQHWEIAGNGHKAAKYYLKCAMNSSAGFAVSEAENYFARYFQLQKDLTAERVEARIFRAREIYSYLGRADDIRAEYAIAVREAKTLGLDILLGRIFDAQLIYQISLGEFDSARKTAEKALAIFRKQNDRNGQGGIYCNLGIIAARSGEVKKAAELYKKSLKFYRIAKNKQLETRLLSNFAINLVSMGKSDSAIPLLEEALKMSNTINAPVLTGTILGYLNAVNFFLFDLERAEYFTKKAMALYRRIGAKRYEAGEQIKFAGLQIMTGNLSGAEENLREAEISVTRFKAIVSIGPLNENWGLLELYKGKYADAVSYFIQARETYRRINNKWFTLRSEIRLAMAFYYIGDTDRALRIADEVHSEAVKLNDRHLLCQSRALIFEINGFGKEKYREQDMLEFVENCTAEGNEMSFREFDICIARCFDRMGRCAKAEKYFKTAVAFFEKSGMRLRLAECLVLYARYLRLRGKFPRKRVKMLSRALGILEDTGCEHYRIQALCERAIQLLPGKKAKPYLSEAERLAAAQELLPESPGMRAVAEVQAVGYDE